MTDDTDEWARQVRDNRAEKDRFLREHRQSPIPPDERDEFDGLDYFDPAPEYRVEGDLAEARTVTLDFNLAYTPFCAFNDAFACPLPPEKNWLETTVEAGERAP